MNEEPKITQQDLDKIKIELYDKADKLANRIVKVYMLLQWKWAANDRTPTTQELKQRAYDLIDTLEPGHNTYFASSGGLTARYFQRLQHNDEVWWEGEIKFETGEMEILKDHREDSQ